MSCNISDFAYSHTTPNSVTATCGYMHTETNRMSSPLKKMSWPINGSLGCPSGEPLSIVHSHTDQRAISLMNNSQSLSHNKETKMCFSSTVWHGFLTGPHTLQIEILRSKKAKNAPKRAIFRDVKANLERPSARVRGEMVIMRLRVEDDGSISEIIAGVLWTLARCGLTTQVVLKIKPLLCLLVSNCHCFIHHLF